MNSEISFMKKITLSIISLFISSIVFCQTFMHGAGITVLVGSAKGGDVTVAEGFTYSPRFNFLENETLSVSVGIPLSIGISAPYSTSFGSDYYNAGSTGFVVSAPLMINLNMGRGSTKENTDRYGYFFGGGIGYHHGDFITIQDDGYGGQYNTIKSTNTFGLCSNAGFRIGVGSRHRNIEVRFSYMKGINEDKPNIFGIGALFNF